MENKNSWTSKEMFDEIEAYAHHLAAAKNYLDAYECLLRESNRHNEVLNLSPGFFTMTLYALSKCLMIELAKLYVSSRNDNEKTFCKLTKIVRANEHLFGKNIKELCAAFDSCIEKENEIIKRLKARRDKDLVHNDPIYFNGKINPSSENYISLEDANTLYNLGMNFCKHLLDLLDYEPDRPIVCTCGAGDLSRLIKNVKMPLNSF